MFTGIIEELGTIQSIIPIGTSQYNLTVTCQNIQDDLKIGDSVAVNGACLTVIQFTSQNAVFQISSETYLKTLFSKSKSGQKVNLERALKVTDRLGGHIVQGHIDSIAKVLKIEQVNGFYEISFTINSKIAQYFVYKGSVTIDGISLTIADLQETSFKVAVIPLTFQHTNFSILNSGDSVHIETDIIARYVERLLNFSQKEETTKSRLSVDFLKQHGF